MGFITDEKVYDRMFIPLRNLVKDLKPYDNLYLSAIGARICYSSDHPLDLIQNDERIVNKDRRISFLSKLVKAKHYSVFAHSPVFFNCHWADIEAFSRLYKAYVWPDGSACLNARHLTEILQTVPEVNDTPFEHQFYRYDFQRKEWAKGIKEKNEKEILAFVIPHEPWGWISIIAHGYSRAMTHQFVRHTWLNFSQRSHRYTYVDGYVTPYSAFLHDIRNIKGERVPANLFFSEAYDNADTYYAVMINNGIPKEDARYVTPVGARTTIMASAPFFVWMDFVKKRNHSKAQWEIRELAFAVAQVLDEFLW